MDSLYTPLARTLAPFLYPGMPEQRIYWLYLLTSLLIATAVFYAARRKGHVSAATRLRKYLFPREVFGHRSARIDYRFFIVNTIGLAFFIAPILLGTRPVMEATMAVLRPFVGGIGAVPGAVDHLLYTAATIVALDAGIFLAHYLQHKVPVLWEFHKVHHSAEVLTPITVYRVHPVDDIVTGSLTAITVGVVAGVFHSIYAITLTSILVFNLNLFVFVFYFFGYNLRHSHIWLAYPRGLSHFLISPAQHQIHHSSAARHFDRNFGFIFAFWDRMAGSLYVPEQREALHFGLDGDEHLAFDSVWQLYARPFRRVMARYRPRRSEP